MSTGERCQITGCNGIRIGKIVEYGYESYIPFCQECLDKIRAGQAYRQVIQATVNGMASDHARKHHGKILDRIGSIVHSSLIHAGKQPKEDGHGKEGS